jgi:membrane-bound lytic murein transglycosylase B
MILVKRGQNDTSQKVVSNFLKRVKKSSLVTRKRKTKHFSKPLSDLAQKRKAISTAKFLAQKEIQDRIGKK